MTILKKSEENAKKVYTMLAFQYQPLEKHLLSQCNANSKKQYHAMSYAKKIMTLDILASQLGL